MFGMDRYDPVAAIFSATATTLKRVSLFLIVGSIAHFIGMNIHGAPGLLLEMKARGLGAFSGLDWVEIGLFPFFWVGKIVGGATYILGFFHILLLAALFHFVRSSEQNYGWGLVALLAVQPFHSVYVSYADQFAAAARTDEVRLFTATVPTRFEVVTSSVLLVLWVFLLAGGIWFLARRSHGAQ